MGVTVFAEKIAERDKREHMPYSMCPVNVSLPSSTFWALFLRQGFQEQDACLRTLEFPPQPTLTAWGRTRFLQRLGPEQGPVSGRCCYGNYLCAWAQRAQGRMEEKAEGAPTVYQTRHEISFFFFFWQCWGLNSRPHTC
jgi:hypothetical protein